MKLLTSRRKCDSTVFSVKCKLFLVSFKVSSSPENHNKDTVYSYYDRRHSSYPTASYLRPAVQDTLIKMPNSLNDPEYSCDLSSLCGHYCKCLNCHPVKLKKKAESLTQKEHHESGFTDEYLKVFSSIVMKDDFEDSSLYEDYLKVTFSKNQDDSEVCSINPDREAVKLIAKDDSIGRITKTPETDASDKTQRLSMNRIVLQSNSSPLLPRKFARKNMSSQYRNTAKIHPQVMQLENVNRTHNHSKNKDGSKNEIPVDSAADDDCDESMSDAPESIQTKCRAEDLQTRGRKNRSASLMSSTASIKREILPRIKLPDFEGEETKL